jgi:hypothetical protein
VPSLRPVAAARIAEGAEARTGVRTGAAMVGDGRIGSVGLAVADFGVACGGPALAGWNWLELTRRGSGLLAAGRAGGQCVAGRAALAAATSARDDPRGASPRSASPDGESKRLRVAVAARDDLWCPACSWVLGVAR